MCEHARIEGYPRRASVSSARTHGAYRDGQRWVLLEQRYAVTDHSLGARLGKSC